MRWLALARTDFRNVAASQLVQGVITVLVGIVALVIGVPGAILSDFPARIAFEATTQAAGTLVPIVALVAGYLAVAGERESGSARILLSLPPSRRDVVAGKFLARAGIVLAGILIAFVVGTAVSLAIYRTVPVRVAALTALLTCLLGVAFVGIAVGVSAAVASRARAGALAIGFFVVTVVLWSPLLLAAQFLLRLPFDQAQQPEWFLFLKSFPPSNAFGRLYNSVVGSLLPGGPPPGEAIYLSDAAMVALLVLWTVVPLALGYWQFERTDL